MYELNRQLISRVAMDIGGSMSIFAFGGFYGTGIAIILYFLRLKQLVQEHPNFRSYKLNSIMAGIGALFCWIFFPFLALDTRASVFAGYLGGVNTLFGISACVITTAALDAVIYGRIKVRDMIFSPIAGAAIEVLSGPARVPGCACRVLSVRKSVRDQLVGVNGSN